MEDDEDFCCPECGEEWDVEYQMTNAECDVWLCKRCGEEFQTISVDDDYYD